MRIASHKISASKGFTGEFVSLKKEEKRVRSPSTYQQEERKADGLEIIFKVPKYNLAYKFTKSQKSSTKAVMSVNFKSAYPTTVSSS